jgi:molybdopterin molybdotransferase
VNLVLNRRLTGVNLDLTYGINEAGDGDSPQVSLSGGTPVLGGKGHVLLGLEWQDNSAIRNCAAARDWCAESRFELNNYTTQGTTTSDPFTALQGYGDGSIDWNNDGVLDELDQNGINDEFPARFEMANVRRSQFAPTGTIRLNNATFTTDWKFNKEGTELEEYALGFRGGTGSNAMNGDGPLATWGPGTAIKILTGAPMPLGADTVVQVEHTNASDTDVDIYRAPKVGSNLRQRGEDIHAGEGIVAQQTRLRPAELGVLASVGKSQVMVYQRPRVAILATGDEIADLDDPEPHSKIINSNSYTIAGQVLEAGGVPVLLGVARDTREDISQRLASGLQAEVLITSGGVSAGDFDYVRDCLDAAGFVTQFLTVAMRPGSPVTFGTVGQVPVFSLPGNPVASMVTFELLVRPALLKMQGYTECFRRPVQAALEDAVSKRQGVRTFLRGVLQQPKRLGEMPTVTTTGPQGSGILRSMSLANCLIDIPEEVERLQPGDTVQILPL